MATLYQFPERQPAEILCIDPRRMQVPAEFRILETAQLAEGFTVAYLDIPFEDMRDCYFCGGKKLFVARLICTSGFIGCCASCGNEWGDHFTRSTEGE